MTRAVVLAFVLACLAYGGDKTLEPKQEAEYYRLGSTLLYKQLLAANERIKELEAQVAGMKLEKEATDALKEMAVWRQKVLGDARCTIDEKDATVNCPKLSSPR